MEQNKQKQLQGPDGTATHSGWNYYYSTFSKYRDECIGYSRIITSANMNMAINALSNYHSTLYSLAQQIFSFYENTELEEELTKEWIEIGDEMNRFLSLISDKDFRNQMMMDGKYQIDKELKMKLLLYFNKVDRLAAEAGLLVNKETKNIIEPKKGLVGLR